MSHILKDVVRNLSIDCVIFGFERSALEVLLIKRRIKPYRDRWALPGGFIKKQERIDHAISRILGATTGLEDIYLEEVGVFDNIHRYPYWRVFTIAHFALVRPEQYALKPGIDASAAKWFNIHDLPELPFDHQEIIKTALQKLRSRVRYRPIGFELLPPKFTLPHLQKLYETILGKKVDKRNFRKKILKMGLLKKLDETDRSNKRRAASLYRFDKNIYNKLKKNGFVFEL